MLNSIFKDYDIRGRYPIQIQENLAYKIGRAYVVFLKKENPDNRLNLIISRDNRLSSLSLYKSLIKGVLDQGANVFDIGLSTTPMFYFAVCFLKSNGGIQITASHNPRDENGFKIVREKAIPIGRDSGLLEIKNLLEKFNKDSILQKGKIVKKNILKNYLEFNFNFVDIKKLDSFKIVLDSANAVPGIISSKIFKKIPCVLYHLFEKLDGNFPFHSPDPLKKENLKFLRKEIKKRKANIGIAFDGDGDRVIFIDEKAKIISGDLITAVMAKIVLKEKNGAKILYDIRSSNIVKKIIKKYGGVPSVSKIGHSFIKKEMRKKDIIFAGELSGHYYLMSDFDIGPCFFETPFFVILKILEEMTREKKKISEIINPFRRYFSSGEINFKIKEREKIMKKIEKKYSKNLKPLPRSCKILKIDGLRVDFQNWWFLIRMSNTESLLRLVIEAKTKKLLEQKKKEIISLLCSFQ